LIVLHITGLVLWFLSLFCWPWGAPLFLGVCVPRLPREAAVITVFILCIQIHGWH
jgi:hypothetical protein